MRAGQLDITKAIQAWDIVNDALCDTPYYKDRYPNLQDRLKAVATKELPALQEALQSGYVAGVWNEALLCSVLVACDYSSIRAASGSLQFDADFPSEFFKMWDHVADNPIYVMYCLTRSGFKHLSHISYLLDDIITQNPTRSLLADTELVQYLKIFRDRGFVCEQVVPGYYSCIRVPTPGDATYALPSPDIIVELEAFRKSFVGSGSSIPGGRGILEATDATVWLRGLRQGIGDSVTFVSISKRDRSVLGVGTVNKRGGAVPFEFTISPKHRNEGWGRDMLHYLAKVYRLYNEGPINIPGGTLTKFFQAAGLTATSKRGDAFTL